MRSVSIECLIERSDAARFLLSHKPASDTANTRHANWTGRPSAASTSTAVCLLWAGLLLQQVNRASRDLQLGLELSDPLLRSRQLTLLRRCQTRLDAAVEAVLASPVTDRLVADVEIAIGVIRRRLVQSGYVADREGRALGGQGQLGTRGGHMTRLRQKSWSLACGTELPTDHAVNLASLLGPDHVNSRTPCATSTPVFAS